MRPGLHVPGGARPRDEVRPPHPRRAAAARRKRFCARCGSQLFIRRLNAPELTVVTLGTLDDDPLVRPSRHVFVGSKAAWCDPQAQLPLFDVYPVA